MIDTLYALVSGQEDPRTGHRGHTIHLDLTAPVRFPDQYLLFHKVFEAVAQQGGLSGYAHAQGDGLGTLQGLAIDGPFDLIDFVEIAQGGQVVTRNWFDLLNLGLRIAPAAGTDYPYLDHPGAVRNYVQVPGGYSVDGWFEGLGAGRTFVTTGPLLSVLGQRQGHGRGGPRRRRRADHDRGAWVAQPRHRSASIASRSSSRARWWRRRLAVRRARRPWSGIAPTASRSTWFVVRAQGKRSVPSGEIAAVSAPIYVVVDGDERTWKRDDVPRIVDRLVESLDQLQSSTLESVPEQEWWEAGPVWQKVWSQQFAALGERIAAARSRLSVGDAGREK